MAMNPKQRAAEAALELLENDMVVGLGSGSTSECFLVALAGAISSGRLRGILGVPTSIACQNRATELGIPLTSLTDCPQIDITIDGADEIAPNLDLIKGLGGALLREKIIAQCSRKLVIIADSSKLVPVLGSKGPLPVEVVAFAHQIQEPFLRSLGCQPVLRRNADGSIFVTDNGNYTYDCRFSRIDDPAALLHKLKSRAGIVDCGLFLGMADMAIVASDVQVSRLHRPARIG